MQEPRHLIKGLSNLSEEALNYTSDGGKPQRFPLVIELHVAPGTNSGQSKHSIATYAILEKVREAGTERVGSVAK